MAAKDTFFQNNIHLFSLNDTWEELVRGCPAKRAQIGPWLGLLHYGNLNRSGRLAGMPLCMCTRRSRFQTHPLIWTATLQEPHCTGLIKDLGATPDAPASSVSGEASRLLLPHFGFCQI